MQFAPDEKFAYCNGGYVVLALIAERVSGVAFHDLVAQRVCEPAEMTDTAFLRSDELPGRAARGYLHATGPRTNVFHLPVRGNGDGGIYSTVEDVARFWSALFAGKIVPVHWVEEMLRARTEPEGGYSYGLGFWLGPWPAAVALEGMDSGASFRSVHDPERSLTFTVISNTTDGAWPMLDAIEKSLAETL
jgi:CubicO group peptidase (beta-lactamase class C family)